jgi:TRAP-type C4-dicarboxylate transport system permease small subunit
MLRLLHALDRSLDRLYTACGIVAAIAMVVLAACVFLSIATRQLGLYIAGLTEYSGYAMAASSFLALAYTFRSGGHIRVALLRNRFGRPGQLALEIWCLGIASVLSSFLAWYLMRATWVSWRFEEKSEGAAATPLWIPQSLVAAGATVMAIAAVHALVLTIARRDPDAAIARRDELQAE